MPWMLSTRLWSWPRFFVQSLLGGGQYEWPNRVSGSWTNSTSVWSTNRHTCRHADTKTTLRVKSVAIRPHLGLCYVTRPKKHQTFSPPAVREIASPSLVTEKCAYDSCTSKSPSTPATTSKQQATLSKQTFDFVEATFDFVAKKTVKCQTSLWLNFVLLTKSKQIEHDDITAFA